ncbi:MAG TPA: glycosyltransferase family 4 protein [Acidimicrobiales bacterium]
MLCGRRSSESRGDWLVLVASLGLGGGIERYADTVIRSLERLGHCVDVVALRSHGAAPTARTKARFLWHVFRALRDPSRKYQAVVVMHPSMYPAVSAVARLARCSAPRFCFFFGHDIWSAPHRHLRRVRRTRARAVTISAFSSGALAARGVRADVLEPGLPRDWYDLLRSRTRPKAACADPSTLHILMTFRLGQAVSKGALRVIEASDRLRKAHPECAVRLLIAGTGSTPAVLINAATSRPWLQVVESPSDGQLAALYTSADVFVLPTAISLTRPYSGEGFGIVMGEAQLAGTPVIAPIFGGTASAFLPGITGTALLTESVDELFSALEEFLLDRNRANAIATNASAWAAARFAPTTFDAAVRRVMMGEGGSRPLNLFVDPREGTREGDATEQ